MAGRRQPPRRWSRLERDLRERFGPLIAGVDEVGRGPLAGPVVACAVIMPPDARALRGVDDSKLLAPTERVRLATRIRERALAVGLGAASVREIDRLNIYHASVLAMRRALGRLAVRPDHVLVDGKPIRSLSVEHTAVVGGDGCCPSIACASIVAKVTRDRLMVALARRHPGYLWERNVGYATAGHLAGLRARGLTAHHRRSFTRCGDALLSGDALDGPRIVADAEVIGALVADALADDALADDALADEAMADDITFDDVTADDASADADAGPDALGTPEAGAARPSDQASPSRR